MGDLITQSSFAAGEIGPQLYGRVDQEFYYIGLRTCRNFVVSQYGGAMNRPGTRRAAQARFPDSKMRLVPFQFNEIQTYALEFGDGYMRFISNGSEILETPVTITGATQANPVVISSPAHGYSNGDDVEIDGVAGMVELNGRPFRANNVASNTYELTDFRGMNIDGTRYDAYISGGTSERIYTIETPWAAADLFNLNYAQSNDVLTVVHPGYYPMDITRTGNTAWTITQFQNTKGPFKDVNITATTVSPSALSGSITLTASAALFAATQVGDLFYIEQMPNDATKGWDVQKPIQPSEIRYANANYYQAPNFASPQAITNIIFASGSSKYPNSVVITIVGHGYTDGAYVYIDGIVGTTQVNGKPYKIGHVGADVFTIFDVDTNQSIDGSNFTAYSSGGTAVLCQLTGTIKPTHTSGTATDGDPGVIWTYLHSGFGIVKITAFTDSTHVSADVQVRLPDNLLTTASNIWAQPAWSVAEGYPSACSYHKQRMEFGGTLNNPSGLWFSAVRGRTSFGTSLPVLADEAITLSLDTTQVNAIRHLVPFAQLITLTSTAEFLVNGVNDVLDATNPPSETVQGHTGASKVVPIIIGNTALYVQNLGREVHSLQYQFATNSFAGIDMTARSPHLFLGRQIVDWAYQKNPLSVVWTIMSDGALLGFTFVDEQKVYAWSRHDSDGTFESVCTIPEGNETAVYFVVNRTIKGVTQRFIERLASRYFTDVRDAFFLDCGLSYDGRNTTPTTIAVNDGTSWDSPEILSVGASDDIFAPTDVGDWLVFRENDLVYRLEIAQYISPSAVKVIPKRQLPPEYRATARADWEFARLIFRPLDHLAGKTLSALVDGNVITGLAVVNGAVTLPSPGAVVHIGLPFTAELETLDYAYPQGQTKGRTITIPKVQITVQDSRAPMVTTNGKVYYEAKERDSSDGYETLPIKTAVYEVLVDSNWSRQGRVSITQDLPLPLTINAITPEVVLGSA